MTTTLQSGCRTARRELSFRERQRYDALAEGMAQLRRAGNPPGQCISDFGIYERGMLNLRDPSKTLLKALRGKRLIDMGAGGPASYMPMSHFAAVSGVSEYVIVDRYQEYSNAVNAMVQFVHQKYPEIAFRAIEEDMLRFIAYEPDSSASICMNAADASLSLVRSSGMQREYISELIAQIARVVPCGGAVFGVRSKVLERLTEHGFILSSDAPGIILSKPYRIPEYGPDGK